MANTPEQQQKINDLIKEYGRLLERQGISEAQRNQQIDEYNKKLQQAGTNITQLNTLQSDLNKEIQASQKFVDDLGSDFEYVNSQVNDIVNELGNAGDIGRKILGSFRSLQSISQKIASDKNLSSVMNEKELQDLSRKLAQEQELLQVQVDRSVQQMDLSKLSSDEKDIAEAAIQNMKEGKGLTDEQLNLLEKNDTILASMSDTDKARFLQAAQFTDQFKVLQGEIEASIAREKELNKAVGVTGELIKGLGSLPGLGMVFKASDVEEVKNELRKSGEEANGLNVAGKLLKKSFGNLKDTLNDPAFLFTAVTTALVRNSKLQNQFSQELGVSYSNAAAMRQEIANAADTSGDLFINSEKLQKSFFALKETTGVFFDISSQSAETFTNLTERIGLAGQEAGNLTMLMRLQGKETEANLENMYDTTGAMLQTSKTTASVKDILGDVAKSSKGLQASLAGNPQALAKAAIAARELGATLADMEKTQGALLDFEQSIGAELEAELLTGKQLNLERARAAALNNDMATLGEELKKQNIDLASFGNMNVKQQEAMAKAMGMSRNDLGDMLLKQEMQNKTLDEIRSTMGEQAYEQAKQLSAQDKFNAGMAKLKDLFANIMTAFTPIIDGFAFLMQPIAFVAKMLGKLNEFTGGLSNKLLGALVILKMMGGSMGGLLTKFTGFFGGGLKGIKEGLGGIWEGFSGGLKGATGKFKDFIGGLKGGFGGVKDQASSIIFDERMGKSGGFRDMTSGRLVSQADANASGVFKPGTGPAGAAAAAAPKGATAGAAGATNAAGSTGATPVPADDGTALKKKMQNIAEGIKSFANTKVIKGALSMIVAAPGLIALGLASLPLKITETINGKAIEAGFKGIANGVKAFANAKVLLGGLALIPISLALAAMSVGAIGLAAIALLGAPAAAGMFALTAGLTALGSAAASGVPFLGVALIGAFGLALIPFGMALAAAAPAIEAVGTVIATVITSIADAVVTVMPALTQSLIDLSNNVNLGGLVGLALGLGGLSIAMAGLATSAMMLLPALPVLAAVAGIGAIATGGGGGGAGIGGGGGGAGAAAANAGGTSGEEIRAIVEETVTATINALVPEMVAALKEGQGKIKVTNDNFNNSKQSEGPSRNRNIVNNNFA